MLKYRGVDKERLKNFLKPYSKLFNSSNHNEISKTYTAILPKLPLSQTKREFGVLKLSGLCKSFGKHDVLKNVNLTIEPKKITAIIGVSGSGKTTILKSIIGFYLPTKGVISYKNENIFNNLKDIQRSFGFAAQDDSFYFKLDVEENVRYFGKLYGLTAEFLDIHIPSLLKLVGLYEARKTLSENLSTGMRRRLDIACALIHDPNVLIMDEPTQDLDPHLRHDILDLIKKINKNGTTVIFTSHLLEEVDKVADTVEVLFDGTILKSGTPDQIKDNFSKYKEIHLYTTPGNYKKLFGLDSVIKKVVIKDKGVVIYTLDSEKVLEKILPRIKRNREKIIELHVRKPTLTEVFEYLTKK